MLRAPAAGAGAGAGALVAGAEDSPLGDDSIAAIRVQKGMLVLRPFWAHFDYLVFFAVVVAANFAAAEVAPRVWVGAEGNALLPLLCLVGAGSAMRALVKVEFDKLTPPLERQLAAAVAVLGFVLSLLLLLLAPPALLDFEIDRTSRDIGPAIMSKVEQRTARFRGSDGGAAFPELVVSPIQIMIGLSIIAGAIAGAVFAPAVRMVRCYVTCVKPPAWGKQFVGGGTHSRRPPETPGSCLHP
jgi:hypothetical protein